MTQAREAFGGTVVKHPPANAGDTRDSDLISVSGRSPGRESDSPFQYSCLKNSHGLRSLAAYTPWGHKESNTTENTTWIHAETTSPRVGAFTQSKILLKITNSTSILCGV